MKEPFVDRIEELRYLNRALKYDGEESQVLVFTGIGGMGKTALRIAFEEEILKPNKIPYALLDYDGDPNLRPIEVGLRAMRRQLGRHKVKTPVFDFLYGRYFELSMGVKLTKDHFPSELDGVADILEGILQGIPVAGGVAQIVHGCTRLGLQAKARLQHKEWLYRIRDLEPREILNLLPEVLAGDLEEAMSLQTAKVLTSSGCRIVLLLDAYELLTASQLDDTLHRKLLLLTPHLLRVIFTRTPLPWEHKSPNEWRGKITHFPALDDLSHDDAMILLRKKGIENPDLQNYLHQLTGGYPMHLELCADICREIKEATSREPDIPDFQGAAQAKDLTEELVRRLLRQLKDDEQDLMCLAVYPRWISEEVLGVLSSVPESVPRIFKKFTGLSMFSPHAEIPDAYVIRKEVRNCLIQQQRKERLFKSRHGKLSAFHRERWEKTRSSYHLREALYHGFYENAEQAMKVFEEHFWKSLDKFSFGETEGLLEAVPIDTVSDKQKRKIDYARARLLTTTAHSKDCILTAKEIFESLIESETNEASLSQYLFNLGELLRVKAEWEEALEYLQKSLALRHKIYGEEHSCVADVCNSIGLIYWEKSDYKKAVEFLERSFTIRQTIYGDEHPDVADSYDNLGLVYWPKGEYKKALEYFQKGLNIRQKKYAEGHPKFTESYNNIGIIYHERGNYEKALENFQRCLDLTVKIYGEEHPDVAVSYSNVAGIYSDKAEYERALDYHYKALAIICKIFGQEHLIAGTIYNNVGSVYRKKGEYEKALECYQKSLVIWKRVYGNEHRSIAVSYNHIGAVYRNQGRYERAFEYFEKALNIRLKIYGEEHPTVASSYNSIGLLYADRGEYGKALEYYQKALAIRLRFFSEKHPYIAKVTYNISRALWELRREEDALKNMQQSVEIFREFKLWKEALEGLEKLAGWLEQKGETKEAEETRAEARVIRKDYNVT